MKFLTGRWARFLPEIALAAAACWILLGFMTWSELANGVRLGAPRADNEYGQLLLFTGAVQAPAVLGVLLLHACTAILGYALVIQPIWGGRRLCSEIWLLLAGMVPGGLMVMALSRVLSLLLPNTIAPLTAFALILAGTAAALFVLRKRWRGARVSLPWRSAAAACVLIAGIAVFDIQLDRFHILGEGSLWFMNQIYLSDVFGVGVGHFPLVSQHYDEAALLYPALYGLAHRGADLPLTISTLYWIMVTLGRVAIASLSYVSLRSLGLDRLSALATLAFVCLASLAVNPISSQLLFDSLSPLLFALHMARFLIPMLPLLLVSAFLALEGRPALQSNAALAVATALGVGLSTMPEHAVVVLAWFLPVLVITDLSRGMANAPTIWRAASLAALIVLVSFIAAYAFVGA
ncbi:MAG: hypothetical protein AB7O04_16550, partial [Hyphomonadaceae bacterium]